MKRYLTLSPRIKAKGMAYNSSIASRSKRDEEMQKQAELEIKKLESWKQLHEKNTITKKG